MEKGASPGDRTVSTRFPNDRFTVSALKFERFVPPQRDTVYSAPLLSLL
jgi:hypothetical protein